jgi:hypothetical protein
MNQRYAALSAAFLCTIPTDLTLEAVDFQAIKDSLVKPF